MAKKSRTKKNGRAKKDNRRGTTPSTTASGLKDSVIPVYTSLDRYITQFFGHSRAITIRVLVATGEPDEETGEKHWHFEEVLIPRDGVWSCFEEPNGAPEDWGVKEWIRAEDEFETCRVH